MSRAPFQHWMHSPSDSRYLDTRNHAPEDEPQGLAATTSQSYSAQEPPRFLLPGSQGYEPTLGPNASHSRFPLHSRPWDSGNDPKHSFSPGTAGSLAQYSIQRSTVSRNAEYAGPSSSHFEASNRSRGSIGSAGRTNDLDSQYSSSTATFPSPVHSDKSPAIFPPSAHASKYHLQPQPRPAMPSGFENILHHEPIPSPPPRRASSSSRYHLHIRQQPIAARACGAGDRDRRPVDPPPILQMLLTDFDLHSEDDRAILQDNRFTVGCILFSVSESSSWPPPSELDGDNRSDNGAPGQATPLLSGKTFVTPFNTDEEPDPDTAPPHPSTNDHLVDNRLSQGQSRAAASSPASFFIFSDLSVRTAGLYRLQFRLMNWGMVEDTGQSMPILAEIWSDPFRVYPAKDFPGMRDSSLLTERLKEFGVVELKTRGKGKGKGRRVKDPNSQQD